MIPQRNISLISNTLVDLGRESARSEDENDDGQRIEVCAASMQQCCVNNS